MDGPMWEAIVQTSSTMIAVSCSRANQGQGSENAKSRPTTISRVEAARSRSHRSTSVRERPTRMSTSRSSAASATATSRAPPRAFAPDQSTATITIPFKPKARSYAASTNQPSFFTPSSSWTLSRRRAALCGRVSSPRRTAPTGDVYPVTGAHANVKTNPSCAAHGPGAKPDSVAGNRGGRRGRQSYNSMTSSGRRSNPTILPPPDRRVHRDLAYRCLRECLLLGTHSPITEPYEVVAEAIAGGELGHEIEANRQRKTCPWKRREAEGRRSAREQRW